MGDGGPNWYRRHSKMVYADQTGILSRFQSNPSHQYWVAGKKVLRYLQRTKAHMLVYKRVQNLELHGYTDSDFAGNYPSSMKSTCGYVFMLVGGAVAWKTMKQNSTEVYFKRCTD
ncbi:putative RNA-directed DNA polymerase [Rosa chinensis]|uniref:Putative RNA-directed DNA polymerase n=1 Tax=Rosa chinensis TaxID=74649 RepID=A0A2P6RG77_ROSCH|nr:putative RNA-directed DNA polymerase [Rosa chinensis]